MKARIELESVKHFLELRLVRGLAYFAIVAVALAIIYQGLFRYSYTFVDNPPLFNGVLRIDHLTGNACISWGIAPAKYRCNGR